MRVALPLIILATLTGAAHAQTGGVDTRCTAMKDPVGCTCALAEGGSLSTNAATGVATWARARGSDPVVYETCVADRGGKGRARPQTIPGRL